MAKKTSSIRLDENISGHKQKKFKCPACGQKRYVRFYDFQHNDYIDQKYGRCDRSESCGYYLSPYSDEKFNPGKQISGVEFVPEQIKIDYVDKEIVKRTLTAYDKNQFVLYLERLVGTDRALELAMRFYIGTSKAGGTIFWQVDNFMMIRTGQLIFYKADGHRDKSTAAKRLFKVAYDETDVNYGKSYRPCLFGLHQLFTETGDFLIAICESEKTALLASIYMPDVAGRKIVWMASSGSNGLTDEKIAALRGRDVCLVPDFSFHARATWGAVPMRKKYVDKIIQGETKPVLLPHPDGDVVEYESAADRLRKIGCSVSFFDPCPGVEDGSDIADMFVREQAPDEIILPDFSSLLIDLKQEETERPQIKPSDELSSFGRANIPDGRHSFKFVAESGSGFEIMTNNDDVREYMTEKFVQNPDLLKLFTTFGLESCAVRFGGVAS